MHGKMLGPGQYALAHLRLAADIEEHQVVPGLQAILQLGYVNLFDLHSGSRR